MTDKEIKTNILAEIERLKTEEYYYTHDEYDGFVRNALDKVVTFINSLPEEPIPTPNEKMDTKRWKEACKAACCDANYRSHYGLTETRDDYFVDGVQWADEHPIKEPVSEDLIQASEEYVSPWQVYAEDTDGELLLTNEPCERAFIAGAQWQKKKTINKVVEWLKENVHKYADSFVDSFELCKDLKQILEED